MKHNILILSNEPWSDVWFIKHRYAVALSKLGFNVFFINAPGKWKLNHLFDFRVIGEEVMENLTVLQYKNPFPLAVWPWLISKLNDFLNSWKLRNYIGVQSLYLWQFDHTRFVFVPFLNVEKRIYHVADPYFRAKNDHKIAAKANLIICTSRKYLKHYSDLPKRVIHIPHCVDLNLPVPTSQRIREIRAKHGRFLIYTGLIDDQTNLEVAWKIHESGVRILFIGRENLSKNSKSTWQRFLDEKSYLGTMKPSDMLPYIYAARGCLILYKFEVGDLLRTPLKVLDYMRSLNPTVTSIDPDVPKHEQKGIFWAKNTSEYLEYTFKVQKGELSGDEDKIKAYLSDNTYEKSIVKILNKVGKS